MGVCDSESVTRTSTESRNMAEMRMHKEKSCRSGTKRHSSVEISAPIKYYSITSIYLPVNSAVAVKFSHGHDC